MKNFTFFIILLSLLTASCNSRVNSIFGSRTPHERYEKRMDELDIDETPIGKEWKAASAKALHSPVLISLPFRMQGVFPADKPRAIGLEFTAKQGEQLRFELQKNTTHDLVIYADLFKKEGMETEHLFSAETDSTRFVADMDESGTYILRLQPQIQDSGDYTLTIISGPSLGFPLSDKKARVGSFWGDSRDGGTRRHEGIDIFAPKKSPAIAAADGYITGVDEGGLGGKTVWLRPSGKNYSLYYAHLDAQLVQRGQFVKKGETIGLVGNTGNAKHTPAHLHFGIYTYGGAVDPFPFVNPVVKNTALATKELPELLRLTKAQKTASGTFINANTVVVPIAVTAKNYIAELPDGTLINAPFAAMKAMKEISQTGTIASKQLIEKKKS